MSQDTDPARLLAQLDLAEAQLVRYETWGKRARRYLVVKLPVVGITLYGVARLDMLGIVIPLMLFAGTVMYFVPWLKSLGLRREREALLLQVDTSEGGDTIGNRRIRR